MNENRDEEPRMVYPDGYANIAKKRSNWKTESISSVDYIAIICWHDKAQRELLREIVEDAGHSIIYYPKLAKVPFLSTLLKGSPSTGDLL